MVNYYNNNCLLFFINTITNHKIVFSLKETLIRLTRDNLIPKPILSK